MAKPCQHLSGVSRECCRAIASAPQSGDRVYGSLFFESSVGGVLDFLAFREHNSTVSITECSEKSTRGLRDSLIIEIPTNGSIVMPIGSASCRASVCQ